jgi:hypothetical protein
MPSLADAATADTPTTIPNAEAVRIATSRQPTRARRLTHAGLARKELIA